MYEIEQVIKHRKPMRLVDQLLSFDDSCATVSVKITEAASFFDKENNGVPSYVGIEYMAQSIAAYAGANALHSNRQVSLGFLLGTRKYQPSKKFFSLGETLIINVEKLLEDASGLSVFNCTISSTENRELSLATAKINVYQPEDADKYFQEQS